MAETYKIEKGKALVFNVIFLALCCVSVFAYFFFPLFRADIGCTLNGEQLQSLFSSDDETSRAIAEELSEEKLEIDVRLTIRTSVVIGSFSKTGKEILNELIDDNAAELAEEFSALTEKVVPIAVKAAAKTAIKEEIEKANGETVQIKDPENLERQLDNVLDELAKDDATPESVADAATEAMASVYFSETGEVATEEQKEEIRNEIRDMLQQFADENGNIDMTAAAAKIVLQMLNAADESEDPSAEEGKTNTKNEAHRVVAAAEGANEGATAGENATERLQETLKEKINENIGEDALKIIGIAVKAVGGALLFSIFSWVWVALKIVLKFTSKRPMVRLWFPIVFGWFPVLLTYVLPKKIIGAAQFAATVTQSGISLSVFSASVFAAIASLVTCMLSIAYRTCKYRSFDED